MSFNINSSNFKQYLVKDKYLVVNTDFINTNSLETCSKISIQDIIGKELHLIVVQINLPKLIIEVKNCLFNSLSIKEITIERLIFISVEISESKEGKFTLFEILVSASKLQNLSFFYCKLYNGLIVKESQIESLSINETAIDRSFTFLNSTCKTITVESSSVSEIIIEGNDYPKADGKTEVETIYIFRTEGLKNIKVREAKFKNLHIHKIIFLKTEKLSDDHNEIFITVPDNYKDIVEIKISKSIISATTIIAIDSIKHLEFIESNLNNLILNYWKISSLLFSNCRFNDSVSFGGSNRIKTIDKLLIENCTFEDIFNMNSIWFKEEASFRGLIFKKYPSFFRNNIIEENCKTDFQYSNLQNLVFQEIDFRFFSFKEFDITNVEFRDCRWQVAEEFFINRNLIVDDDGEANDIEHLKKIKDIYSKLKISTQKSSDFLNYGKFYISEQEAKRKIHRKKSDRTEYLLMGFHKAISSYGENFKKPLLFIFCSMIVFSILFMFTGFYVDDKLVKYEFSFQASNFVCSIRDFGYSLIYSFKNILPFQISLNFYLHSDKSLQLSQTLELIHKVINLILVTSFTAAFVRYLRK